MSQVVEILRSLGINSTVYYQFVIFFVAFISMNFIVFKPYLRAYDERLRRTVGGEEEAEHLLLEADKMEEVYRREAKKLNEDIKAIFNEANSKARAETEEIMNVAKVQAETEVSNSRRQLEQSVIEARKEMATYIPKISENIERKLMRQ